MSPRALRRAARWDGWLGDTSDPERNTCTPAETAARVAALKTAGARPDFDICFIGYARQADLAAYAAAGVTWWLENVHGEPADVLRRVRVGPPGETLP